MPSDGRTTLVLCALAALLEGFDTQSMGVAAPRVIAEFGLTAAQAGIMFSSTTCGLFIGAALGGRVADYVGRKRALLAVGMAALLPDRRHNAHSAEAPRRPVESIGASLFGSDRAGTTLMLWAGFFFTQLVLLLMLNWLPSLVIGLGFSRTQASWAAVCFNLGGSLGAGFLGRLHAGERRRRWVLITYGGMAAALAAVASAGPGFAAAALACAIAGVFIIGAQLILFALAPLYYHAAIRGTGVGAAVAMGRLGSVAGPLIAGGLLANGGGSVTVLLGIVPFVMVGGGAAFALTYRERCNA